MSRFIVQSRSGRLSDRQSVCETVFCLWTSRNSNADRIACAELSRRGAKFHETRPVALVVFGDDEDANFSNAFIDVPNTAMRGGETFACHRGTRPR